MQVLSAESSQRSRLRRRHIRLINPGTRLPCRTNNFQLSEQTSTPSIGLPNTAGRGSVQGGALESSTVDIATEFTNLIVFQRSYEASAKVVTTADTLSEDTINLIPSA